MQDILAVGRPKRLTLELEVIRRDGRREHLGVVAYWHKDWWCRALWELRFLFAFLRVIGLNPMRWLMLANVLANAGRAIITNRLRGNGTEPLYAGWGTGAGTAAVGDTTLFTETYSTTNNGTGNQRATGTSSQVTTSVTNDTYQVVATLTVASGTGAITVTNMGLLDTQGTAGNLTTAPSGGNIFVKGDFTGVALAVGESIQGTFKVQFT